MMAKKKPTLRQLTIENKKLREQLFEKDVALSVLTDEKEEIEKRFEQFLTNNELFEEWLMLLDENTKLDKKRRRANAGNKPLEKETTDIVIEFLKTRMQNDKQNGMSDWKAFQKYIGDNQIIEKTKFYDIRKDFFKNSLK